MISGNIHRKMEEQIMRELRTVDSISASDVEKSAALDRVVKLKAMLDPQPTAEQLLRQLADAIVQAMQANENQVTMGRRPIDLEDIMDVFRRR